MKKFTTVLLAMAMVTSLFVGCGSTEEVVEEVATEEVTEEAAGESALLTEIKERGYIIVGSANDIPFAYEDVETGELAGVDIEILKGICERLGIPDIELKVIDFASLLVEVNNGNIDMVVDGMYIKDERLEIAAFSDVWYTESEAVVVPNDSTIESKEDLAGIKLGAQPGTAFYETAIAWEEAGLVGSVESYDNQANLMTAVNMGKVDAVITDGMVAGYTIAQDSSLEVHLLSPYEPEASGVIGSAVSFENQDFLAELNAALNEMKEDGSLLEILESNGLSEDYFVGIEDGITTNIQ